MVKTSLEIEVYSNHADSFVPLNHCIPVTFPYLFTDTLRLPYSYTAKMKQKSYPPCTFLSIILLTVLQKSEGLLFGQMAKDVKSMFTFEK